MIKIKATLHCDICGIKYKSKYNSAKKIAVDSTAEGWDSEIKKKKKQGSNGRSWETMYYCPRCKHITKAA